MVGVYKIQSPSGKIYIGQSWQVEHRIGSYGRNHIKRQPKLFNSIKKYGLKCHKIEILHELPPDVSQSVLDNYEVIYMQVHKECGFDLLNIREGGSRGKHSDESKKRMTVSQTGRKFSDATKLKQSILKRKPVFQYDLSGNILHRYESVRIAAGLLNLKHQNISACARGVIKRYAKQFWSYN